ncbi:MAG: carbonic anhydrase [Hyphomicrobiaceae bacterium]
MMFRGWFACLVAALTATILISQPALVGAAEGGAHWGYSGDDGPGNWASLSSKYAACATGKRQSPVNLADPQKAPLADIETQLGGTNLSVVNNGHTVQVDIEQGSTLRIDGKSYRLVQFHFHTPSEHTLDGKAMPMEAHFVHAADDGHLAVIGVFIMLGAPNQVIATIWSAMPRHEGKVPLTAAIDLNSLLPKVRIFFRYKGSLTTPPCSETVTWTVLSRPITISPEQLKAFATLYPMNARPVQSLYQRGILTNN